MNVGKIPASLLESTSAAGAIPSRGSAANQEISKQEFLLLFIRQLQAQDPLAPMSAEQLTGQLAQLSSLEQLTLMNEKLDGLGDASRLQTSATLLGLIGREVAYDGGEIAVDAGTASRVTYRLGEDAAQVVATVEAKDGTVVRRVLLGAQDAGEHTFAFDGRDDAGGPVPDGTYRVRITVAADAGGPEVPVSLVTRGTVDGVDLAATPPVLLVGGARLTLDKITEVRATD